MRPDVQEEVQGALARLGELSPEEWGAWLTGILEALEAKIRAQGEEEAFDRALTEVQHYLEQRLPRGQFDE